MCDRRHPRDDTTSAEILCANRARFGAASRIAYFLDVIVVTTVLAAGLPAVAADQDGMARAEPTPAAKVTRLAFLPLDNATGYSSHEWMRTAFPEIVAAKVVGCPGLHVAGNRDAAQALIGSNGTVPAHVTGSLVMAAARRLSADVMAWGVIEKSGSHLSVHLTWTSGQDGTILDQQVFDGDFDAPWALLSDMATASIAVAGCSPTVAQKERIAARAARDRYTLTLLGRALGTFYGVSGEPDIEAARDNLVRALRIDPGNAVVHAVQARFLAETGDLEGASRAAYQALELWPDFPSPHRCLARLLEQKGALEDAADHLEAVLEIDPGDLRSRFELARVLSGLQQVEPARQELAEVLAASPPPAIAVPAYRLEARLAALEADPVSTLIAYSRLLELDPFDVGAIRGLVACYMARNDLESAEQAARLLARLQRDDPVARHFLGEIALLGENFEGAVEAFRDEAAVDPSRSAAWAYLADAFRRSGDLGGQLDALETFAATDPGDPVPLNNMAVLRYKGRDFSGAIERLERAIERAPGWGVLHQNLGIVLAANGESERAFETLLTAVHLDPGLPLAQYHLGLLLAARDDFEGARTAFAAAVEAVGDPGGASGTEGAAVAPAGPHPVLAPALFNLGVVSLELGRTSDAARALAGYLEVAPGGASANLVRQWVDYLERRAAPVGPPRPARATMR